MSRIGYLKLRLTLLESGGVAAAAEPRDPDPEGDCRGRARRHRCRSDPDGDTGVQLCLDRDANDDIYLPETSIAGALRAHLHARHGTGYTHRLLGAVTADARAVASRVSILASVVVSGAESEIRTTTAIDRVRGAARTSTLRSQEFATAGTAFDIYCSWLDPDPHDWTTLIDTLAHWSPLIGHAVSTGHGRSRVTTLATGILDLDDSTDLLTYLTQHGRGLVDTVVTDHALPDPTPDEIDGYRLLCTIDQALHIGTGCTTPQIAEFFTVAGIPTIPGSTLKGILRSRIEYILRSVDAHPEPCTGQDCQRCLPCRLFGYGSRRGHSARRTGARSHLRILDTPLHDVKLTTRTHAPIDRFTGGVADQTPPSDDPEAAIKPDGLLHTLQVVENGIFTLRIEYLQHPPAAERDLLAALLRLVVQDVNDGLVTLGRGGTRGHGRITVTPTGLPTLTDARRILAAHVREGASDAH